MSDASPLPITNGPSGPKANVLLVDDHQANLLALEALLEDPSRNLVRAASGEEALRLLLERDYAVVLLDVQMHPGLDGFETARLIRGRERSRTTPIIFLTAHDENLRFVERAYALGAVDYLVKPLVPVILRAKVAGFIELFQKTEQVRRQAEHLLRVERGGFERSLAEENARLRESEGRLRTLSDNLPAGAIYQGVIDPDGRGRFTYFSAGIERLLGITPDEIRADPAALYALIHEDDRPRVMAGEAAALRDLTPFDCEFRQWTRSGTLLWVHCRSAARRLTDGGAVWDGIVLDATDRKRAEQTVRSLLRVSERLNASLDVDALLDDLVQEAIGLVDAESGVAGLRSPEGMVCKRYFQKGAVRPLDYCWPPMHGLPGWLLVHKAPYLTNDALADTQIVRDLCIQFGVRSALSTPVLDAAGEVLGFFEVHNKRAAAGFGPADRDMLSAVSQTAAVAIQNALAYRTILRAEEALRDADRRKDQFVMMLAHELRNPLAPIRTAMQVVQRPDADRAAVEKAHGMVERQVRHLTRIVDDLLDVSRVQSGKMSVRTERLDLGRLARTALEDQRAAFDRAGVALHPFLPELPVWVTGDPTRLTQVLDNLLQNAVKFTDRGGSVAVRVEADAGRQRAVLTVRDTGVGIEPDLLPRLFETFTQADTSLDRSKGGLGLGLSLVKGLAELHSGTVEARSDGPGRGAEFVVWLPLQPEPAAINELTAPVGRAPKRLRVLVVEDNRDAADSLQMLLEVFGYEVAVAYTGPEGVAAAKEMKPDAVVCDIGLPGLDGYGVARALRRNPATATARMIAVTGYGDDDDRRRTREAGFDAHLTKPADAAEIQRLLAPAG